MDSNKLTAVLLLTCPDRVGLISRISHFIFERQGNIIDLDEHVDQEQQLFSIRVAWDMTNFTINAQQLQEAFAPLAKEFQATWSLRFLEQKSRVAIFVSKRDHCLNEILWRYQLGEYNIEICCIVSNHSNLKPIADQYQIPVHVFPVTKNNKKEQETKELQLLQKYQVDTIVLARYMQILSPQFVKHYPNRIINIHHSFLPAFAGSNPYRQAFERGVKIIGATSHYVTEELDQGPIIEQDVIRISHKDTLKDLIRKGRDLERLVLAKALRYHFEHRILVHGRKTIIFE
ncbi:MAG: formyltetrahydrofolate deformylase [Caldisericaceae bacterium]|nr:formyltetrahydrofolate deformylase [Caldisericaceae bacterium]